VILLASAQFDTIGNLLGAQVTEKSEVLGPPELQCRRLRIGNERFLVILASDYGPETPLDAHLVLDDMADDRLEAIARFWSALHRNTTASDPRLTKQRKRRLRDILRAVDGRQDDASYRVIAEALFPQHRIDAASWAGNALRETTIRLVRDGLKLVDGGYRTLLRRSRKR
jgi:hypothetical protein